jgi:antitoxin component YwqK of YwqJK toxin-antitoxin module
MKAFLIFILSNIIIAKSFSQSFYDTSYHQNGKIRHYGFYNKQKQVYLNCSFYFNGNLQLIHQYDSSNFMIGGDSIKAYNINGTFAFEMVYKKGLPEGDFKVYYSNGVLKREGQYYRGFKSGEWREFHPNGKVASEYSFILSRDDSTLTKELSIFNFDSTINGTELIELGEEDSTLGSRLQFINLLRFGFNYFLSTPNGIWKKYDVNGNLISSVNHNKKRRKKVLQLK